MCSRTWSSCRSSIGYETAQTLLFGIERVIVVYLAALAVIDNRMTIGMLFAFIAYKDQFSLRLSALIDRVLEFMMLRLHGERVADIVLSETEPDRADASGEADMSLIEPSIELRAVSFRFSPTEPHVIYNINLSVRAGECVAITGVSGCGKTTLVKVMLGLLAPTSGEVLVGGQPVTRIGLANYRQSVGTVMQ